MYRKVNLDPTARIKDAVEEMANTLRQTLGPGGKHIVIQRGNHPAIITKDGVTVAANLLPKDPLSRSVKSIMYQASEKTVLQAGDGTTTACILTAAIYSEALRYAELDNKNKYELVDQLQAACTKSLKEISGMATKINMEQSKGIDTLRAIGTISANNDAKLGALVADAVAHAGPTGLINVKMTDFPETRWEKEEGFSFPTGFINGHFMTDQGRGVAQYDKAILVLMEDKVDNVETLMPFIDMWDQDGPREDGKALVFVCSDMQGEALISIARSKVKNGLPLLVVKAPYFTQQREEVMEDLRIATGAGKVFSTRLGFTAKDVEGLVDCGECCGIRVTANQTFITPMATDKIKSDIESRVATLKIELNAREKEDGRSIFLRTRIASLESKMSIIYVGGEIASGTEERNMRVDDSWKACQSALRSGYVQGCGIAYLRVIEKLTGQNTTSGEKILAAALSDPFNSIITNIGENPELIRDVLNKKGLNKFVFNGRNKKYLPYKDSYIYDSAEVVSSALRNAVATACTLLTTGVVITDENVGE